MEILFKAIWTVLILITIYFFGWLTFVYFTFGNIGTEKYTIWNLIIPNILTLGILIIYSKELLIGYKTESKQENLKSLILFSTLILVLILLQLPQFELLFEDYQAKYWQIILCLIIVFTSYVGIILNRVLKFKELKKKS